MSHAPSGPDLELIVARLNVVRDLLERIKDEVGPGTVRGAEAIVERYRPEVYAAMEAVGMAVYEFLQSRPAPDRIAAAQALVISNLRESSLTSPIALYGAQAGRPRMPYFEVVDHVRAGTMAGADVPTRVLDDYYIHTHLGQAFLNRLQLFNRRLIDEVVHCQSAGLRPFHIVSLQYVGGDELLPLARNPAALAGTQITCLDSNPAAVRHAQQTLRPAFNTHAHVIMADPVKWLNEPSASSDSACLIYAVSLLELLPPKRFVRLMEGAYRVLRPDGVLLAGCTAGNTPVGERMIRDWLLGWDWRYRSEAEWRELFAQTPFGAEQLAFEYEPSRINALIRVAKAG